jgi:hypothetical protein
MQKSGIDEGAVFSGIEEFTPNKRLNEVPNDVSGSPSIAFGDGTIYVVWQNKGGGIQSIYFSKSMNNGTTFSPNIKVDSLGDSTQKTPEIAVSGKNVFIVWEDFRNGESDIFLARSFDGGDTFEPAVQVNTDPEDTKDHMPFVEVDEDFDAVYVTWVHGYSWDLSMNTHPEIHLAMSQEWGSNFQQTKVSDSDLYDRFNPVVAVDGNGKVYVAWSDGRRGPIPGSNPPEYDFDVYIANSTNGGLSFGTNSILNEMVVNKKQRNPSIAIDSNNDIHAVWVDERFENEKSDIMYARSSDGSTFGKNVLVNNSSPSVINTLITDHQAPSISVDSSGNIIHVVWSSNRGGDNNIYIAKSSDGGQAFGPASSRFGGSYFFDHISNGAYDVGEAVILDDGNDLLDPGILNGNDSPDRVIFNGTAKLVRDTLGSQLAYRDSNSNNAWDPTESIVSDALTVFTIDIATSKIQWDNTSAGNSLSSLRNNDSSYYKVNMSEVMGIDGFSIPVGLLDSDPLSSVIIRITYNTSAGYSGNAHVFWSLEVGSNNSLFIPVDTNDEDLNFSAQLYPTVDSVDKIRTMNISFVNNDPMDKSVRFDEIEFEVSRGLPLEYDTRDAIVYNGSSSVQYGDILSNFSLADRVVFMDSNGNGEYTLGEPIIKLSHDLLILTEEDAVLMPPDNGKWTTYFCPFPLNDDMTFSKQTNPALATDPWGNVYSAWEDLRALPPDIYYTDNVNDNWPPSVSDIDARASQIRIMFSEPVNVSSFDSSFSISPGLNGIWSWNHYGYIATFQPSSQVLPSTKYDIVITTGLQDISGNFMSANFLYSFITRALPVIIHDAVATAEVKVSIPLGARIIDLDGIKSAVVFHRVASERNYTASNMNLSSGTIQNGYWTFSIPPPSNLSAIHYYIVATDAVDEVSRAPISGSFEMSVVDLGNPLIQHITVPSASIGSEIVLTASVADNLEVESVLLYVRPVGATDFNPPVKMTGDGYEYSVSIDVGDSVGTLEYYIRAVDSYGTDALSPDGGKWAPHEIEICADSYYIAIFGLQAASIIVMAAYFIGVRKKRVHEAG